MAKMSGSILITVLVLLVLPLTVFGFANFDRKSPRNHMHQILVQKSQSSNERITTSGSRSSSIAMTNTGTSSTSTSTATTSTTQKEMSSSDNPRKTGLALQLDDGTRKSHSFAQNTSFVTSFFKGLSNRQAYQNLLTSLYFVYEAMEEAFDSTDEEYVKLMDYDQLRRLDALKKDMEYFHGIDWERKRNIATISPSYATQKYVKRIQTVANENPKLLIAHQYTRYLGDLFGGQMMGGMASKSLNLEEGCGTAFYTFDTIDNAQDFITTWYRTLNSLDLTEEEKNAIVDEANLVFDLNIEILQEIEGDAFSAVMNLLWKSFRERIGI